MDVSQKSDNNDREFALLVDSEHKATEFRLFSVALPHGARRRDVVGFRGEEVWNEGKIVDAVGGADGRRFAVRDTGKVGSLSASSCLWTCVRCRPFRLS
ncbi:hypothetical protein L1887_33141 [Cichorium endivia]|nr:hypothetical protein L1887_33141 [Cichorium endivia]